MYRESSSVQKYRAQKDSRRENSNTSLVKEKHKLLNTTNPNFQYDRPPTLSPSQKSSQPRGSLNYQNILSQIQPSSTKNSKTPIQTKQQAIQNKKNDLLKQYLKNTIGAKKPIAKYENKENRDYSNTNNKTIEKENETPLDKSKYQSKIEAYMQTVKNLRPQSASKNATPKAVTMNSFMSPKNVLNYTINPTPKAGKTNVFAVKDMNALNNTAVNTTTVFRYPESRDGSFVQPAQRGKSTDPTAAKFEESRRPSSNKMLIDLDDSVGYSPSKRPQTTTNSRAKEEFKNMLNVNIGSTKHDNNQSKAKYFKFNDFSNDIGVFEVDFSPIHKNKNNTTLSEALNSSTNNVKDSLMRISKNLANQPYPTLIKQINLASNTPTNSSKPPLYNFTQSETPTNRHFPVDAPIKKPLDYYQNKVLAIQTAKENKKIEFPQYLQNYTYDRTKSKKDLSFNLEPYIQERESKTQKLSIDVPSTTDPTRKVRCSSENPHDFVEHISKKILDTSLVQEKPEVKNRYSVGAMAFQNEVPQSKTPKGGSYAENHLRNIMNTQPQPTGIKQIDTNIKTITELFKATTPTTAHPPSNISAIAEKYLREDKENDKERDRTNQLVQPKPIISESKPELRHEESTILEQDQETRERKIKAFRDEYVIGKQIGQGAYAKVCLAIHKPTNRKVAIKIYEKQKIMEPMRKKSVRREIKLMQKINHEHVIKIYDTIESNNHVNIIMEYVGGMSLHTFLKQQTNRRLKEENAFRIFKQISHGLQYCHARAIAHRDIKLENILLDQHGNVKIIDFGFSTCIPNDKKVKMFCGTPSYMAPEIVQKIEYCGPPADIWALGVLLYALLCGAFPFKGENDKDLYRKIVKGEFIIPDFVSDNASQLIRKMLTVNPDKRPTLKDIFTSDPWYIMHSTLEPKREGSSHRKSLSIDKGDDFRPNLNQPLSTKDQNAPQVNNFMKPPTNTTPTGNQSKINFKEGSASKTQAKPSSPRTVNGGISTPTSSAVSQTNNYYINNKNIIYNINFKDQKGSKGPNDTDILGFEEPEEDAKRKKSLNETEIWGNNGTSTEKSYRKDPTPASRGSVGTVFTQYPVSGRKESLPSTATPSVTHYDIEIINNLVKMGYKEDEINQGLKTKDNIIFTVYTRLLNEKKAMHNHNALFLNKDAINSFVSPSHHALKKRFELGNNAYTKNSSLLDTSGMTNKDNSINNTSEILKGSYTGKDINVSDTDIVVKLGHH